VFGTWRATWGGGIIHIFSTPAPTLPTYIPSTENGHKPHSSPAHRAKPSRARPGRAEPKGAEPSRAGPSRAERSRAEPGRARTERSRAEPGRSEPGRGRASKHIPPWPGGLGLGGGGWVFWGWSGGCWVQCPAAYKEISKRKSCWSREISGSPPPRGNHVEGEINSPFFDPCPTPADLHRIDRIWPQTALQPSTRSQADPGQAGLSLTEPSRGGPDRAEPNGAEPSRTKPKPNGAEPSRAEPSRAGPGQAKLSWAGPK
jgi:hypothetical protein